MMDASTRRRIRKRAGNRCEYCHVHQDDDFFTFHVEHIVAKRHGGSDDEDNLCLACRECNCAKGTNIAGLRQGRLVRLFNPRRQKWNRHFEWKAAVLVGRTRIGTVTVALLNINTETRTLMRSLLIAEGRFPPKEDPTIPDTPFEE